MHLESLAQGWAHIVNAVSSIFLPVKPRTSLRNNQDVVPTHYCHLFMWLVWQLALLQTKGCLSP